MKMNKFLNEENANRKEGQIKGNSSACDVDSPYAKYNSRGQLTCIICGVPVKSKIIWQAHINKRSHKENLANLKEKQEKISSLPYKNIKRSCPTDAKTSKKICIDKPKGILKKSSNYKTSDEEFGNEEHNALKNEDSLDIKPPLLSAVKTELSSNFFDERNIIVQNEDKLQVNKSELNKNSKNHASHSEALPEGFFDDPVQDAKARNVEYRDKEEEEWLSFMKEVSAAEMVSEKIIAEDKEEAAFERQIEQTNEQIICLERIVKLDEEKKTQLQVKKVNSSLSDNGDSSDEEFSPVIWRTKNSLI